MANVGHAIFSEFERLRQFNNSCHCYGQMLAASELEVVKTSDAGAKIQKREDAAAQFVTKFIAHHHRCRTLAKRFAVGDAKLKDSAALSQLCRVSNEMLEQAKDARAMTEIYLALDDKHREAVLPIIIKRFKDILKSAEASWRRFCDTVRFAPMPTREIQSAQQDFEPHAMKFYETLELFIALGERTS